MKNIFTRGGLIAGLTALLSIAAFAQTPAPQNDGDGEGRGGRMGERRVGRGERRGEGGGRGMMERRALGRLNLSDAQRNRIREIEARYAESLHAEHLEIRRLIELRQQGVTLTPEQRERVQELRGQLRDSAEKMHNEFLALLTPEQRDQLKRMREEGKERRRQRREADGRPNDDQ
ncbi:MAG TPA: Spy/CpxP family protein refolding chaperone [Pyrinomonadaceae bacterium]|nr:Spy/CpxP family protein refolding chaperone [Pyrinomonadaceae bacterium]